MSKFIVLTVASNNRRIAMRFDDKKITNVGESVLKENNQNCTVISFKEIKTKPMLPPEYGHEEVIRVKENFEEVLNKLGIVGDSN